MIQVSSLTSPVSAWLCEGQWGVDSRRSRGAALRELGAAPWRGCSCCLSGLMGAADELQGQLLGSAYKRGSVPSPAHAADGLLSACSGGWRCWGLAHQVGCCLCGLPLGCSQYGVKGSCLLGVLSGSSVLQGPPAAPGVSGMCSSLALFQNKSKADSTLNDAGSASNASQTLT